MVEQLPGPSTRVIKRVVQRPVTPAPPPERSAHAARPSQRLRQAPASRRAPRVSRPPRRRLHVREATSGVVGVLGVWIMRAVHALTDRIADAWFWLLGVRLPVLSPIVGSVATGLLVGFLAVGLGRGIYEVFEATLGTVAAGWWGFLALLGIAFVSFIAGELLLAGFAISHGRAISMSAVLLVLVALMVAFIDLAEGVWAVVIIPALSVAAFATTCLAMQLAGLETNAQRIPWEPTDDSVVT